MKPTDQNPNQKQPGTTTSSTTHGGQPNAQTKGGQGTNLGKTGGSDNDRDRQKNPNIQTPGSNQSSSSK